jgi:penicillin-binding protein 2
MNNLGQLRNSISVSRITVFYGIIAVVFMFFGLRLFSLQVLQGPAFLAEAENNRTEEISLQTQRGIIYDRNGYVLARNVASYNVTVTPASLPDFVPLSGELADTPGSIQAIYRQLSELLDIPVSSGSLDDEEAILLFKPCETDFGIAEVVFMGDTNSPYDPIEVACNVSRETAMMIQELSADLPGVGIEVEPIREYPTGSLTAEIIGFLGPLPATEEEALKAEGWVPGRDKVGYAGAEFSLQDILSGKNGMRTVEVDVAGQEMRDIFPPVEPIPGNNVRLTIDTRLQNAAKASLKSMLNYWNTYYNEIRMNSGAVIAMNPKTGEILALVSEPTYENNRMARLIPSYYYNQLQADQARPLFNSAISGEQPPGSVYKMVAAIGILNEGVVTPEYQVEDPGKITIEQKFSNNEIGVPIDYVCWDEFGHGMVDFLHGVAWSCDVYWYKVGGGYQDEVEGNGLGVWRMAEYARALGYGQATGIELPGEEDGLVPDPDWKRVNLSENWATGDTYIATMGQGYVLATPLQVLVSIATLANDGKYMQPTIVREILDAEGNVIQPFQPQLKWDITKDPIIREYDENSYLTGNLKTVEPWTIEMAQQGMRMVNIDGGTADMIFQDLEVPSAGKTGTAEYCDDIANEKGLCNRGSWPAHAWYAGYAPYDDPEIVVLAFVYNGNEGATVSGPIVRDVIETYFELKDIDAGEAE